MNTTDIIYNLAEGCPGPGLLGLTSAVPVFLSSAIISSADPAVVVPIRDVRAGRRGRGLFYPPEVCHSQFIRGSVPTNIFDGDRRQRKR